MAVRLDSLRVWARDLITDPTTSTENRIDIPTEIYNTGLLRNQPLVAQHVNQLWHLISAAAPPLASPHLQGGDTPDDGFLRCDGSTFTEEQAPIAFLRYSGTTPDLRSSEPTGHIYVIREA